MDTQEAYLRADCVSAAQDLLSQGIVVHACILAAHAQQRLMQPWKEPGCCPIGCHCLHLHKWFSADLQHRKPSSLADIKQLPAM